MPRVMVYRAFDCDTLCAVGLTEAAVLRYCPQRANRMVNSVRRRGGPDGDRRGR